MTSGQLMRRIRWVVVGGMTVFFILVTVLVFQIAIRMNNNRTLARLETEQAALREQLQRAGHEIEYMQTWQFIEDWAREHLGLGRPGQSEFVRP
ncbi:MAG: hypothetical protein FWE31_01040 [Firmicutes bacterium]|nr:hypothetical protein [Bacillota bacterium]